MTRFELVIKPVPDGPNRESRLETEFAGIIAFLQKIPPEERVHIKITDGSGSIHRYDSLEQVKMLLFVHGTIRLQYIGNW